MFALAFASWTMGWAASPAAVPTPVATAATAPTPGPALEQGRGGRENSEGTRRIQLATLACGEFGVAVRRIVGVEIGDMLLEPDDRPPAEHDNLTVTCRGHSASIDAASPGTPPPTTRVLRLADFPGDAAPRAVALAGLEALAAISPVVQRRLQARVGARPPPMPGVVPAARPLSLSGAKTTRPFTFGLSAIWRSFPLEAGVATWGGRAAFDAAIGARSNVTVDVDAAGAERTTALGVVDAVLVSAGTFGFLRAGGPDLQAAVGAGARLGVARLTGYPVDAATAAGERVWRPWGGPAIAGRLVAGRGALVAIVAAELGVALIGAEGVVNADTVVTVGGPWVLVTLGGGFRI